MAARLPCPPSPTWPCAFGESRTEIRSPMTKPEKKSELGLDRASVFGVLKAASPSPQPSPSGRGSVPGQSGAIAERREYPRDGRRFSLFLGERVGVRGKRTHDLQAFLACLSLTLYSLS